MKKIQLKHESVTRRTILLTLFIAASILTTKAQYTLLHAFPDILNGQGPYNSSLISDGTYLYGMTSGGGIGNFCSAGCGVIFKIKPDGSGYSKLYDFLGFSDGLFPYGSLILDGTYLYGMTYGGGINNMGTIFKIKTDGTGYLKLLDFSGVSNGSYPQGSLISDGTFLYGMTYQGGTGTCFNGCGVIFKIKLDGTGYLKLLDFSGTTNGSSPLGSLISDGTFLYGMTNTGGTNGLGTAFKIMPDGTGYLKLLDFDGVANGRSPQSDLYYDGTFLYGMTAYGGTSLLCGSPACGVIFKIMPDGTGFSKLLDFSGIPDGYAPPGTLISDGTFLYGVTYYGGINNQGTIFKIKPDGTGYNKLFDFPVAADGYWPIGTLFYDGTFFYGMASAGGINDYGTIFKYQDDASTNIAENFFSNSHVSIYPTLSNGNFTVSLSKPEKINYTSDSYRIQIQNVLGEIIYSSILTSGRQLWAIDLSSHPNGIYFLGMQSKNEIITQKLILQK